MADRNRQVAVAEFSLIGRSGASKKGPINHEFVNLTAEFANISRAVIGKSDPVAESRDRAWSTREPRSIKYRPVLVHTREIKRGGGLREDGRKKVKWDHGGNSREIQRAIRRCQDWIIRTDSFRFAAGWTSRRLKSRRFNFELSSARMLTFPRVSFLCLFQHC